MSRSELPPVAGREAAAHYGWGEGCDGWHLVRDAAFSVIAERMPPGAREVRHRHDRARQFFYVLVGELTIERDGHVDTVTAASGLEIPPGVTHEVRNEGARPAEFLVISVPPSHGDRRNVRG